VLRPDCTIPIARYYIDTLHGKGPARLFYVSNVFSFEETGTETREIWQCGAECIGASSIMSDVELIVLAIEVLRKLGLKDIELRLSHAGLIRALLSTFDVDAKEQHRLIDRVLDGDAQALASTRPELARVISPILNAKGRSSGFLRNIAVMLGHDLDDLRKPLDNFIALATDLDILDVPYEIDITSGRGFEYYTGLIFQLWSGGKRVAGGGRYDALIPLLGGNDTPASGIALSVNALMGLIGTDVPERYAGKVVEVQPQPGAESMRGALAVMDALHKAGFMAALLGQEHNVDKPGARWRVQTRDAGWHFSLRDLEKGDDYEAATADEIVSKLRSHIS
jgi:histidyl-tRNA synthetase